MNNKIAFIADLHVRLLQRHEEYKTIFETQLIPKLEENNVKIVVIIGDLVHSKTQLSPELIDLISWLIEELSNRFEVIITLGNHDCNLSNLSRLDAITPIIKYINPAKVHLLKQSGVYPFVLGNYNLIFGNFGVLDSSNISNWPKLEDTTAHFSDNLENITIALYHGIITNSRTDVNHKFYNDGVPVEFFDGWNYLAAGDIHKFQYVRPDQTGFFCGSLISQDFGESAPKGFVSLNLDTKKSNQIILPNDSGFYSTRISGLTVPETLPNIPSHPRLRILTDLKNLSITEKETIRLQAYRYYNPIYVSVMADPDIVNEGKETNKRQKIRSVNVRDLSVLSNLLSDYLVRKKISEENINKVLELNKKVFQQLEPQDIQRGIGWKLRSFEFNNLFGYGEDNYINFENLNGITGLFAKNKEGKSSLINGMLYTIFNTTAVSGKGRNLEVVNNKSDKATGKVIFDIDDDTYGIERRTYKNKGKTEDDLSQRTECEFYKLNGEEKLSLNGDDRWATEKNIRNLLGEIEDLLITSISPPEMLLNFINSEPRERKNLLAKFLDLGIFEQLYQISNKELDDIEKYLKQVKKKNFAKELTDEEKAFDNYLTSYKEGRKNKQKIKNGIKYFTDKVEELARQKNNTIKNLDITEINKSIKKIEDDNQDTNIYITKYVDFIDKKGKEYSSYVTELEKYHINSLITKLDDHRENIKKKIGIENSISSLNNSIDTLEYSLKIKAPDDCNYIGYPYKSTTIDRETELKKKLNEKVELEGNLNQITELIDLNKQIEIDVEIFNDSKEKINKLSEEIKLKNSELKRFQDKLIFNNDKLQSLLKEKDEYYNNQSFIEKNKLLEFKIKEKKVKIDTLNEYLEKEEKSLLQSHSKLQSTKDSIKRIKENIDTIKQLEDQFQVYRIYMDAMHRDGISNEIIAEALPSINSEINKLLSEVIDFEVDFECTDGTKKILIWYTDKQHGKRNIEICSGMEKTVSSIAIRAALANLSSLPKPDIFIIDEGFGALDGEGITTVASMFELLLKYFSTVLIVSHVDALKDNVTNLLEIHKENDRSKIYHL